MNKIFLDSADLQDIETLKPTNVTTNPSLFKIAAQHQCYNNFCESISAAASGISYSAYEVFCFMWGSEILKLIPGELHLQLEPSLSHNSKAMIKQSKNIIALFGPYSKRIVIKIPATLEGISAATILKADDIRCNMTMVFGLAQALLCAQSNLYMIAPYVGRITDWHKHVYNESSYPSNKDPGLQLINQIQRAYRHLGADTKVLAASLRNNSQAQYASQRCGVTLNKFLFEDFKANKNPLYFNDEFLTIGTIISDYKNLKKMFEADRLTQENLRIVIDKFIFCSLILKNMFRQKTLIKVKK